MGTISITLPALAEAKNGPNDRDHATQDEAVHQCTEDVLFAHKAAIEQTEARDRH